MEPGEAAEPDGCGFRNLTHAETLAISVFRAVYEVPSEGARRLGSGAAWGMALPHLGSTEPMSSRGSSIRGRDPQSCHNFSTNFRRFAHGQSLAWTQATGRD
jgi:hypothetical protein